MIASLPWRTQLRWFFIGVLILPFGISMASYAWSDDKPIPAVSQEEKKALENGTTGNWYSEDSGKLVFPDDLARDYLKDRHRSVVTPTSSAPRSNTPWFSNSFWTMLQSYWVVISICAVLVFAAILLFFFFRSSSFFTRMLRMRSEDELKLTAAKISDLPFQLDVPVRGLLEEAEDCRQRGDYSRAIIYLFSYVLVELDRNRRIRLQRGKTNRMYLREIKNDAQLKRIVERIMLAFEWVFFGRHELSEKDFNECWNSLDDFKTRVIAVDTSTPLLLDAPTPTVAGAGGMS